MVYSGTVVTYGRGRAVVVATAMQTEFGQIAQMMQTVETTKTPLQDNLDRVGVVLARAALIIVAIIVGLDLFRGQPFIEMLIFGIALAVAVVPEALPAVVTVSLAIGVQRMVKRNALVRRLLAVETLGSTSVICSDKTGTLTKDEMTARCIYVAGRTVDISGVGYAPEGEFLHNGMVIEPAQFTPLLTLLQAADLASDARMESEADGCWQVKGDPTEGALVVAAAKAGLNKTDLDAQFPRLNEIPFTSESKRMTTLDQTPAGVVAYAKGAPEVILDSCTVPLTDHGIMPLDAVSRERIADAGHDMARQALRVLGIAYPAIDRGADLYINLSTDGLPALALSVDPPEADLMQRQPRNPRSGIFSRPIISLMLVGGVWLALANLGLFVWAINTDHSVAEAMTMTFVVVVLFEFVKAYNFRSDRHSVFRRPWANKWLNLAIIWELLLLVLIVYLLVLHVPFSTYSLPLSDWAIVLALALTVIPVLEIAKWVLRRQNRFGNGA